MNWLAVALVYSGLVGMLAGAVSVVRPVGMLRVQTRLGGVAFFAASAADPRATRAFAAYWRMIHPGSALIRVMWLRAIRLRAET